MKRLQTKKRNSCFFIAALISLLVCVFAVSEAISQDGIADQANASYRYNPKGKTDPFKPLVREAVVKKDSKPQPTMGATVLERFAIEQMKLVGIGSYEKTRIAVITDPRGRSHILAVGSPIGLYRGKVAEILSDQVIVEELLSNTGKRQLRRIQLRLYKGESEEK